MRLIWISLGILVGTIFGIEQNINMAISDIGYFTGFTAILLNKRLYRKFSFGAPTAFQNKMTIKSIILLLIILGGPHFQDHNYR